MQKFKGAFFVFLGGQKKRKIGRGGERAKSGGAERCPPHSFHTVSRAEHIVRGEASGAIIHWRVHHFFFKIYTFLFSKSLLTFCKISPHYSHIVVGLTVSSIHIVIRYIVGFTQKLVADQKKVA